MSCGLPFINPPFDACSSVKRKSPEAKLSPVLSKGSVTLNARKPWPTTVTLTLPERFRQDVKKALNMGNRLQNKQRMSFVRSVYEHFSLYTL